MDKEGRFAGSGSDVLSLRNGPVQEMDIDTSPNGAVTGKRKSRASLSNGKSYKEATDSEDDEPLVSLYSGARY